jgi:hypothetical protein
MRRFDRRWTEPRPVGEMLRLTLTPCLRQPRPPYQAGRYSTVSELVLVSDTTRSRAWNQIVDELFQFANLGVGPGLLDGFRPRIQQFDESEDLGQGGAARRGHSRSATGYFAWKKELPETLFQDTEPLHDVSEGPVAFRHRRAIESSYGVVETFIDDADPQEEVGQQNRMRASRAGLGLAALALALGRCPRGRMLAQRPSRFFCLLSHDNEA